MTTETHKIMLRQQRAAPRQTIAPDIRLQNAVRNAAAREDQKDQRASDGSAPRVALDKPLDIGTDAVYSTLPNNAGKMILSEYFQFVANPA